jgi:hypothetical protein
MPEDFDELARHGASVVWSPVHDLTLYGKTLDIKAAHAAGVQLGIGPSWSLTGSKNLLWELKWARAVVNTSGAPLSERDLVAAATRGGADILGWSSLVGSLEAGKRADLLVLDGVSGDPYKRLVDAIEQDVKLVMVNGAACYGETDLMRQLGRGTEHRTITGRDRSFDLRSDDVSDDLPSVEQAERLLDEALSVASRTLRRDALTAGETYDYAESVWEQRNIPRELKELVLRPQASA